MLNVEQFGRFAEAILLLESLCRINLSIQPYDYEFG